MVLTAKRFTHSMSSYVSFRSAGVDGLWRRSRQRPDVESFQSTRRESIPLMRTMQTIGVSTTNGQYGNHLPDNVMNTLLGRQIVFVNKFQYKI